MNSTKQRFHSTKRKAQWTCLSVAAAMGVGLLILPESSMALTGVCSNCHTMHYSQDGGQLADWGIGGPFDTLLTNDCLGCHTGVNTDPGGAAGDAPFVQSDAGAPTYDSGADGTQSGNTLAGGSFYWVSLGTATDDPKGHNVVNVTASVDSNLNNTPPGWTDAGSTYPGTTGETAPVLTCAGITGCHGDRAVTTGDMDAISGAHHGNLAGSLTPAPADPVGAGYRFLKGVHGYEDADWEFTASDNSTDHNQYKGVARSSEVDDTTTISGLCAQCHNVFHNGTNNVAGTAWGSPWVRHPTDFDMGDASGTEYAAYTAYQIEAPAGSVSVAAAYSDVATAGSAIVTCISCHRAHGSPYDDLLRWDYTRMTVGAAAGAGQGEGCFNCHTAKDA